MSDFLVNLARRGAGLAPIIGSRSPATDAVPDFFEEHGEETATMPSEATTAATPAASSGAALHAVVSASTSVPAIGPLPKRLSAAPATVIQRVPIEARSAAPSAPAVVAASADRQAPAPVPTERTTHGVAAVGPAAPLASRAGEPAPMVRQLIATVTSDAIPASVVAEWPDAPVPQSHAGPAEPASVDPAAERLRADAFASSAPEVTRATIRVERDPLRANVPVPVAERSDPVEVVTTRVERTLEHASPTFIARAQPTQPEAASRAAPVRDAAPPRPPAPPLERLVEPQPRIEVVPARDRARSESVPAGPSRPRAPIESPVERVVHVRIGTVEIHAVPRGEPSPAAAPIATSPELPSGFDAFARLRTYAPWQR